MQAPPKSLSALDIIITDLDRNSEGNPIYLQNGTSIIEELGSLDPNHSLLNQPTISKEEHNQKIQNLEKALAASNRNIFDTIQPMANERIPYARQTFISPRSYTIRASN